MTLPSMSRTPEIDAVSPATSQKSASWNAYSSCIVNRLGCPAPAAEASAAAASAATARTIMALISVLLRRVADARPRHAAEHLGDLLVLVGVVWRQCLLIGPRHLASVDRVLHLPVPPAARRPLERHELSAALLVRPAARARPVLGGPPRVDERPVRPERGGVLPGLALGLELGDPVVQEVLLGELVLVDAGLERLRRLVRASPAARGEGGNDEHEGEWCEPHRLSFRSKD